MDQLRKLANQFRPLSVQSRLMTKEFFPSSAMAISGTYPDDIDFGCDRTMAKWTRMAHMSCM